MFKGHAIPVDVARYIADKINLYAEHRATPPDASAMRKALERFDSVAPDESIGCYGGSGQWIELGTVADLRALAGAKP